MSEPDLEFLKKQAVQLAQASGRTFESGGGGGHSGGMDPWQTSVESRLNNLSAGIRDLRSATDRDFRWTWGGLVALFLLLAGIMAKGFHWIG